MRIQRRGAEISAELNAMDEPVVEWGGQSESVILTRKRGDAEIGAEKQRERENERGDSNYATHKHPKVQKWLSRHPRFHIYFTPTSSSWLNMVERFFRDLTQN